MKNKKVAKKKETLQRIKKVFVKAAIAVFLLHIAQIVLFKWIQPPLTLTQFDAVLDGHTFKRDLTSLTDISLHLQLAVISAEDQLFAQHHGLDIESIKKAINHNEREKTVRGASTISQQTAKNVFLWQGRSWIRKGLEVYYTFLIEKLYGKKRILELYLNVAEMGPGIFGAEAAAQHYFGKSATQLSKKEAARIAACLPNPKKYSPKKPSRHIQKKARWILTQMAYLKTRPNTKQLLYGK